MISGLADVMTQTMRESLARPRHIAACLESARLETLARHRGFARNHLRTAISRLDAGDQAGARQAMIEVLEYIGVTK